MSEQQLDASEIVERLKKDEQSLKWEPLPPGEALVNWRRWPTRSEESLDYLHNNWALPDSFDPYVAGSGLKGRLVRLFGRLTFRVLGPYLRRERETIANLVRINDALARRCDDLASEITRRQTQEAANDADLAAWLHEAMQGRSELKGN